MNLKYQYRYLTSLLKRYGFRGLVLKTLERSKSPMLSYTKNYLRYQPTAEELAEQEIYPGTVRLSIGTEHIEDLLVDLEQALAKI